VCFSASRGSERVGDCTAGLKSPEFRGWKHSEKAHRF